MSGHYDELTPEQVDAARTVIAVLTASDENASAVMDLVREQVTATPALAFEGFAIVLDALLQLIGAELALTPREVLDRLARHLAS